MSRKRKFQVLVTVFAMSILMIAGTFAWTNFNAQIVNAFRGLGSGSDGTVTDGPGGTLHNAQSEGDENRQVFIENWGNEPLFVRIKLDEYMEMGSGAGYKSESINQETGDSIPHPGNLAVSVVSGASIDVVDSWTTHVPNESTPHECDTVFHDYWQWEMGGQKFFFPAPEGSREDPSFVATHSPANLTEESVNEDGIYAQQTRSAEVRTMAQWIDEGTAIGDYWVIDSDGWAYWAAPLLPGDATGLLLNQVSQVTQPQYDYFYGINVVAQMATHDLHEVDNYRRFGDESNGGWTANGQMLMELITRGNGEASSLTGDISGIVVIAGTDTAVSAALTLLPANQSATTDLNGEFAFSNLDVGSYTINVNETGFLPANFYIQVFPGNNHIELELVPDTHDGTSATLSGEVVSATTGAPIDGTVTIELRQQLAGSVLHTFTANPAGEFSGTVPSGYFIMTVLSDGFVPYNLNVAISGDDVEAGLIQLSPVLEDESFRIVLSWGASPVDLDAHLRGPRRSGTGRFHVFWNQANRSYTQNGITYATLDVDVQNGFGPETITINTLTNGLYEYFVHDYTNRHNADSIALRDSTAFVRVYNNSGLYRTFNVPTTGTGNVWHVFSIEVQNGVATIIPSNAPISHQSNAGSIGL